MERGVYSFTWAYLARDAAALIGDFVVQLFRKHGGVMFGSFSQRAEP